MRGQYPSTTKFLIVDDISTKRKFVKRILTEMGYTNTVEAVNGQNAFEILQESAKTAEPIELIISDWNMPVSYGIEFLKLCKKSPEFKSIPFILVTAESEPHQILEAAKKGVSDYVVKPFSPAKVKEKIERVYQRHKKSVLKKS